MLSSDFAHEALPFVLGLLYIIASPLLDKLTWRAAYRRFYEKQRIESVHAEQLVAGATWAVNLSQVVPGVLLAFAGALLALDHVSVVVAAAAVGLAALLPLCLVAYVQDKENIQDPNAVFSLKMYSLPQLVVAGVDVVGIAVLALR